MENLDFESRYKPTPTSQIGVAISKLALARDQVKPFQDAVTSAQAELADVQTKLATMDYRTSPSDITSWRQSEESLKTALSMRQAAYVNAQRQVEIVAAHLADLQSQVVIALGDLRNLEDHNVKLELSPNEREDAKQKASFRLFELLGTTDTDSLPRSLTDSERQSALWCRIHTPRI